MNWSQGGGEVSWPLRSSDLSCLGFFLWEQLKHVVYETSIVSPEELVVQISVAAADIRVMAGIFQHVRDSMHYRCEVCNIVAGRLLEHFL